MSDFPVTSNPPTVTITFSSGPSIAVSIGGGSADLVAAAVDYANQSLASATASAGSATEAQAAKVAAEAARDAALGYRNDASGSAIAAQAAQGLAEQAATNSALSETSAAAKAADALASANAAAAAQADAGTSAANAAGSEAAAGTAANTATAAATAAASSADTAGTHRTFAETARTGAEAAQGAAETAAGSASMSAGAAITAAGQADASAVAAAASDAEAVNAAASAANSAALAQAAANDPAVTTVAANMPVIQDAALAVNIDIPTINAAAADAAASAATAQTYQAGAQAAKAGAEAARDLAYTYQQSAASAVAYQDLAAIAASKAVTAVDVFIYDTSKDSDGGAWRHRCAGTSWYNEPLNTATRGARRDFPTVAVIVAEGSKVTIYDGDDPSLPMWMVFTGTTAWNYMFTFGNAPAGVTSVAGLNGRLAITTTSSATNASTNGVFEIVFPADTGFKTRAVGRYKWQTNIADRNASPTASWLNNTIIGPAIVSDYLNDVAMTVLPDAPIDPATGLPMPTIAVATAGGVSVIKQDGTVVSGDTGKSILRVGFDDRALFWTTGSVGYWAMYTALDRLDSGLSISPYENSIFATSQGNTGHPKIPAAGAIDRLISDGQTGLIAGDTNLGLSRLTTGDGYKNTTSRNDRMLLQTTSLFTSGWMPGDIRGAFLADIDSASLVEGNNLAVGLFSPDRELDGTGTWREIISQASVSGGILTILHDHVNSPTGRVVSGTDLLGHSKTYRCRWTVDGFVGDATGSSVAIGTDGSGNGGISSGIKYGVGSFEALISVPVGSSNRRVAIFANGGNPVGAVSGVRFSAFTVEEVVSDRSVSNKGLIVNGTVTRSPVADGAELVAYSGFSSSNYLEQPYNSGLDFGTGDFCIMAWSKTAAVNDTIIERWAAGGVGARILVYIRSDGKPEFVVAGATSGSDTVTGSGAVNAGAWRHICALKRGTAMELYVDGVMVSNKATIASVGGFSNASAVARVGARLDGTQLHEGLLALLRISATAPTADQIRRIYEDEKVLFQENAACTLYGASDAVTALAHDPDTGLLHVGTSAGRSVFQGLRRVSNTTTAVTAAISAANGMIVEQ